MHQTFFLISNTIRLISAEWMVDVIYLTWLVGYFVLQSPELKK